MTQPLVDFVASSVDEFVVGLASRVHFPTAMPIFRGQGDVRWGLSPSIRRASSWDAFGGPESVGLEHVDGVVVSDRNAVEAAARTVVQLLRQVISRQGLPPELAEPESVEGYAQHLGLPTRMLDWTRSPWVAAYFAASAHDPTLAPRDIVVYAVNEVAAPFAKYPDAKFVPARAFGNENLIAQSGKLYPVPWEVRDLMEGLEDAQTLELGKPLPVSLARQFPVVQVRLPARLAPQLLERLREEDTHAATIYPGGKGVSLLVQEIRRTEFALYARGE